VKTIMVDCANSFITFKAFPHPSCAITKYLLLRVVLKLLLLLLLLFRMMILNVKNLPLSLVLLLFLFMCRLMTLSIKKCLYLWCCCCCCKCCCYIIKDFLFIVIEKTTWKWIDLAFFIKRFAKTKTIEKLVLLFSRKIDNREQIRVNLSPFFWQMACLQLNILKIKIDCKQLNLITFGNQAILITLTEWL